MKYQPWTAQDWKKVVISDETHPLQSLVDEVTRFQDSVLRKRNAMECHSELVEALGNNALPYLTVARWKRKFQQGRVSTSDEQRSGRQVSEGTDLAHAVIEQLMGYIKDHGLH
ncbi:uncharacterized protein TNCV_816441 [Trichonephila clavipes]|nr:uncharacterized protein TNCV_816441 [Trichonephila clavipes]